MVHVSTDEVYGSVLHGFSTEDEPLDPRSPYSASKAGSDLMALSYYSTYGLPVDGHPLLEQLRAVAVPREGHPAVRHQPARRSEGPAVRRRANQRDWLYVVDNCAAIDAVLRAGQPGEIYNIGAGNELTNRDLTERLLALAGAGEEMIDYVEDRLGHDRRYAVDSTKVRALGWQPERQLDEALAETFAWYRDNRWWWEPLKATRARQPPG